MWEDLWYIPLQWIFMGSGNFFLSNLEAIFDFFFVKDLLLVFITLALPANQTFSIKVDQLN